MKVLNLGCGKGKIKDSINLDIKPLEGVDIVHNLEETPLPFKDKEFDLIYANMIFEHIENLIPLIEDLHRILKPNGMIKITVPHFSTSNAFVDITHKRFFSYRTFNHFKENSSHNYYTKSRFDVKIKLLFRWWLKPFEVIFNKTKRLYESTLLKFIIPMDMIYVEMIKIG